MSRAGLDFFGSVFPFLFGGTFIEAFWGGQHGCMRCHFPSFSEGLSLRLTYNQAAIFRVWNFPSFSEGLSLRLAVIPPVGEELGDFPSFSEGLSLRLQEHFQCKEVKEYFPSFSEGLSLRPPRQPR